MSGCLNKASLIGYVGRDPEIRYTQTGEPVAHFSLATSESWTDKAGQKQKKTEWHSVVVFGKTAQVVRDYVVKGTKLYVEGAIVYETYHGRDGNQRKATKIKASAGSRLLLLSSKPTGNASREEAPSDEGPEITDDDVPF